MRKVWRGQDHLSILKQLEIPKNVINSCQSQFSSLEDKQICQRAAMAGMNTATFFQELKEETIELSFKTPDTTIVTRKFNRHPIPQCRLDTYYQGALCVLSEFTDVDQEDSTVGTCNRSDNETIGVRPLCWFKPIGN